jgi:F-type H+-transporting ATPase subunit epsilon
MKVRVATPEKILFNDQVDDLIIEGAMGQLNILPRHTNFVSFVMPGPLRLRRAQRDISVFQLSDGIVKVEDNDVTVLCATAEELSA